MFIVLLFIKNKDIETSIVPSGWWLNTRDVAYVHNVVLLHYKKIKKIFPSAKTCIEYKKIM